MKATFRNIWEFILSDRWYGLKFFMVFLVLSLLMGYMAAACAPSFDPGYSGDGGRGQEQIGIFLSLGRGVYRTYDQEAGVVCYIYNSDGISCLPIEETNLRISR